MATDRSFRGRLRELVGLQSTLEITKAAVLKSQQWAGERAGNWRCACGHLNLILYLPEQNIHPLGLLQCRACPLIWHPSITPKFKSQNLHITIHTLVSNTTRSARIVPQPQSPASKHVYVCLGCGLSWRADIKREWLSGNKRQVLLLGGKRGKLHCDCGARIFQPGLYEIFEIMPAIVAASALLSVSVGAGVDAVSEANSSAASAET